MYEYIVRVNFISIPIKYNLFTDLLRRRTDRVRLPKDSFPPEAIARDNEFIRLTNGGHYMDCQIKSIVVKNFCIVTIGKIIDNDLPRKNEKSVRESFLRKPKV